MACEFRPPVWANVGLLIALAGGTGSGKTESAMRLATGIVGPGKRFAMIDTEAGRGLLKMGRYAFDYFELKPPFTPDAYAQAVMDADRAGYAAIVIDSMSHEYEGEGGIIEWADQLERNGTKSPGNWKVPKAAHKKMMNRMLHCRAHLIFCLRADDKIEIRREGGKTVVVQPEQKPLAERWVPICEKRFMFEMTASFVLTKEQPGVAHPIKLEEMHQGIFPPGRQIDEDTGRRLAAWRPDAPAAPSGGQEAAPASRSPQPRQAAPAPAQDRAAAFWAKSDLLLPGPGQEIAGSGGKTVQGWPHWAQICESVLKACPGPAEADRWLHDNGARLEIAGNHDPAAASRVQHALEQARGRAG